MTTFLKVAGAFLLGSVLASGAMASPAIDAALGQADWYEDVALPSATDSSLITRDILLANAEELVDPASDKDHQDTPSSGGSSSQSDSCPQCTCCCCQPTCYVSVGTVILHRDRPNSGAFTASDPGGAPFGTGGDFDFGWNTSPDITIGRRLSNGDSIEARFFDDDGAEANTSFRTPGNFIGPGFIGPGNTIIEGQYRTLLYSSELNYRHHFMDRVNFLAGFRWVELTDDLRFHIDNTVAEADYRYNNHLYGAQIGADLSLTNTCSRLQVNAVGKAGLYGNASDGGIYESQPTNNPIASFTGDDNTTSFIGELDFSAAYWLSCHVAVRGGYQMLWLDNVALSAEAASRGLTNPSLLLDVDNGNNLFYSGATVALDFLW